MGRVLLDSLAMVAVPPGLAELLRVPPGEFVRARDALAARLRKAGQSSAAAEVKALRAPTVPVWVVNRLALEEPQRIEQLIDAAERVRAAQLGRRAEGGGLSAANAAYRDSIAGLLERGHQVLEGAGIRMLPRLRSRVETTLTAAVASPEARKALRAGRIERELSAQGFDVFGTAVPPRRTSRRQDARAAKQTTERPAAKADDPAGPASDARARAAAERAAAAERIEMLRRNVQQAAEAVTQAKAEAKRAAEASARAVRAAEERQRDAVQALRAARRAS